MKEIKKNRRINRMKAVKAMKIMKGIAFIAFFFFIFSFQITAQVDQPVDRIIAKLEDQIVLESELEENIP